MADTPKHCLIAAAALLCCLAAGCGPEGPAPLGRVITLRGSVTAESGDLRDGLKAGAFVFPGDVLVAGGDSSCDVQMKDSMVRLRQETRLGFQSGPSGTLTLLAGKVLVRAGRGSSADILKILVRSTLIELVDSEAVVELSGGQEFRLTTGRGTVAVYAASSGEPYVLGEGSAASVKDGKIAKRSVRAEDRLGLEEFHDIRPEKDALDPASHGGFRILRVGTDPAGAKVYLNGSFIGASPAETVVPLRRKISVKAVLPGYSRAVTNFILKKRLKTDLELKLTLCSETQERHPCLLESGAISAEPLFIGSGLYVVENGSVLRRVVMEKSGLVSEKGVFNPGRKISRPLAGGDRILVGCADGYFYALEAGSLSVAWKKKLGPAGDSFPAEEDGVAYLGTASGFFYALNTADGFVRWQFKTLSPVSSSVAVADEMVCFAAADRSLYGLEKETGTMLWRLPMDRAVDPASPLFDADRFYLTGSTGYVYCVNSRGRIVYAKSSRSRTARAFLVDEGRVFLGSVSGRVQCWDRQTGRPLWQTDLKSPVTSQFLPLRDGVLVGLADGRIVSLDPRSGTGSLEARVPGKVKYVSYFDRAVFATTTEGIFRLGTSP
jgi:outer membrane protein assembly factor BamB